MRSRACSLVSVTGSAIIAALFAMGGCAGEDSRPAVTVDNSTGGAGTSTTDSTTGGTSSTSEATTGGTTTAGGATPYVCKKGAVAAEDATLAPGTNGTWGDPIGIVGGDFGYASPDQTKLVPDAATTAGVMNLSGPIPPGGYRGHGLYFKDPDKCFDISQFSSGIKIQLGGTLGEAKFKFQLQQNNDYPISTADGKGACVGTWTDGCSNNGTEYLTVPETLSEVDIPWTTVTGGTPDALNLADVIGFQLHIDCPSDAAADCAVNLNIGTVTLY